MKARRGSVPGPEHASPDRKADHIRLALQDRMQLGSNFFDDYHFDHVALPEIDLEDVDTGITFLGKRLRAPLLISGMTGGTVSARRINRNLALAAHETGVAMGVGSQRKVLEDPHSAHGFDIRGVAPSVPLLANLGAVQLNYGFGLEQCEAAVSMIRADALVLHLNPLQEAIQPEGQCNFAGLLAKIGTVARGLSVPVIVKEIGCGISGSTARRLAAENVRIIDVAGLGGTSWARIEAHRAGNTETGERFSDWGVPTPECIQELREIPGLTVIGSGGIRDGVDAAKAIALGAHLVGMAYPFLEAATDSPQRVIERIETVIEELRICMFCAGVRTLAGLRSVRVTRRPRSDSSG